MTETVGDERSREEQTVFAVLVTHRRPDELTKSLDALTTQSRAVDHIVVVVADVERALAFYCGTLGCAEERVTEWRKGEVFFPSRVTDHTNC